MTDLLTDHSNTGEIPRVDVGETTQRLNAYLPTSVFPVTLRRADISDPEATLVTETGYADTPALPPAADLAAAQPIAPWERVAGAEETAVVSLLGALGGEPLPPLRPSVPPRPTSTLWQRLTYRPKHRAPSVWRGFGQLTVAVVAVSALLWWVIS